MYPWFSHIAVDYEYLLSILSHCNSKINQGKSFTFSWSGAGNQYGFHIIIQIGKLYICPQTSIRFRYRRFRLVVHYQFIQILHLFLLYTAEFNYASNYWKSKMLFNIFSSFYCSVEHFKNEYYENSRHDSQNECYGSVQHKLDIYWII